MVPMLGVGLGTFLVGASVYFASISSDGWQEKLRRDRLRASQYCGLEVKAARHILRLSVFARIFPRELFQRHGHVFFKHHVAL